uniref:CUE domain-containing protein n=1 Tax=Syphacia muris TaxID=451379 RepID=A0A0N5AJW2_9BILA
MYRSCICVSILDCCIVIMLNTGRHITDEAWANTLFGPTGVLTTIFRLMDDRRRDSIPSPKPVDLAKIFNAFLNGPQGDFEDPVAELPEFLGICNRLSCGDIYKAIDQFRKSDFFTNFQTALQLIQDPKGWEILGDLLSNPELIAQFTKGSGFEHFLGSTLPTSKIPTKKPNKGFKKFLFPEVDTTDRNLGIDFSEMVNEVKFEKPVKPTAAELPEIAESVDRNIDYYSAVNFKVTLSKTTTVRPSSKSQMVITRANRIGKANSARKTTLTPPTTSNFRRDNDYYAMYYDD